MTDTEVCGSSTARFSIPECQTPTSHPHSAALPWTGDRRANDKTRILETIAGYPDSVNLPVLARQLFGADVDLAGADAQLLRRTIKNHPNLFKTARLDGFRWVSPTPEALILTRCKQTAGKESKPQGSTKIIDVNAAGDESTLDIDTDDATAEGARNAAVAKKLIDSTTSAKADATTDGDVTATTEAESITPAENRPTVYARDRARAYLGRHRTLRSPSTRAEMLAALAIERQSTRSRQPCDGP